MSLTHYKCLGFSTNSDKSQWKQFKDLKKQFNNSVLPQYNKWMAELGYPQLEEGKGILCIPHSPYLNIYGYPKELDYTDIRPIPEKWFQVEAFCRKGEQSIELPDEVTNLGDNQKLIYLSMGSMGSIDVDLMKRLVGILAKSGHKVIVSKGVFGDQYELPDNMWGRNNLPQTKILPLVDLVITHGGNNTVTEAFNFGKPMIVLPLFGDQYDNAQRLQDTGYGLRLNPYSCSEEQLLAAVNSLLADQKMNDKLKAAAQRISKSQSLLEATQLIESFAK